MQSTGAKAALVVAALAAIIVLFVVLQSDDDDSAGTDTTTSTATTPTSTKPANSKPATTVIVVGKDGKPAGGVQTLNFKSGEQVRFKVRSAVADEVHIHVYDIEKEVPAGKSVPFSFPAKLEGVFEVESHSTENLIAKLKVNP